MFNTSRVLTSLFKRVGWRQPTQTDMFTLDSDNLASTSGLYFDGVHPAVTVKNIKETMEDENADVTVFNTYLKNLQKDAIIKALNSIFNRNGAIETVQITDRLDNVTNTDEAIDNAGNFVGWRIDIPKSPEFAVRISSIALYFNEAKAFKLYLFSDTSNVKLWEKSVTTVANQLTVIDINDLVMTYLDSNNRNGRYYLGYFQSDLGTAKAIDERNSWINTGLLFYAQPFEAAAMSNTNFERNVRLTSKRYGLNPVISSHYDYTANIIHNAQLFDELIRLQVAADVIELSIHSTRSNGTERINKDEQANGRLYNDLNLAQATDEFPYSTGLKTRIQKEQAFISKEFFSNPKIASYSTD
jgi:hypothetical protein